MAVAGVGFSVVSTVYSTAVVVFMPGTRKSACGEAGHDCVRCCCVVLAAATEVVVVLAKRAAGGYLLLRVMSSIAAGVVLKF